MLRVIVDAVSAIVQRVSPSRRRRIEDDLLQAELDAKRLDNVDKLVDVARKIGVGDADLRNVLAAAGAAPIPLLKLTLVAPPDSGTTANPQAVSSDKGGEGRLCPGRTAPNGNPQCAAPIL
ncbi:MAG: hypothetical protein AAB074_15210 [Planctomycetota bacterium]